MTSQPGRPHRLEHAIHLTLLFGSAISAALLLIGLIERLTKGQPPHDGPPSSVPDLIGPALRGDGSALIDLGLIILIATPALRVAVLIIGWGHERNWRFAAVAVTVLCLLGLSLLLGRG